jgi:hypothetical protein
VYIYKLYDHEIYNCAEFFEKSAGVPKSWDPGIKDPKYHFDEFA